MKIKGITEQFSLPLNSPRSGLEAKNVITGQFKTTNAHLDSVTKRLANSGVFASKPPTRK